MAKHSRTAVQPGATRDRRLVVVSNRLPFQAARSGDKGDFAPSAGGLVSALEPALRARGGHWIGWHGLAHDDGSNQQSASLPGGTGIGYSVVPLSSHEVAAYYGGFSNRTLWPLFHYFVGRTTIDDGWWRAFERVNRRFAEVTAAAIGTEGRPLVWIHDYHLLRLAHHLRPLAPHATLAFFLHIPFPAADVLRVLPWARDLLRGMLAADYVGFHVPSYVGHFLSCAESLLGCEVDRRAGSVQYEGRRVGVGTHPISIDVDQAERLAGAATLPLRRAGASRRGRREGDRARAAEILGVDRLDYTKGIVRRLLAIERLLEEHPSLRRQVQLTQVLVPSRERVKEYGELKREIDETVGRVNGTFSEPGWSPIRYFVRALPPGELFAAYRRADVALVTPLRDGMNLVSKEYVAAQLEDDGVLILSEFAGAAEELQEAITVNPFDVDAVAEAIHRALVMPEDERHARMSALRARVRAHDVHAWVRGFIERSEHAAAAARATVVTALDETRRRLAPWLAERQAVALFLDYDGTLTPIIRDPAQARLSDAAREAVEMARRAPQVDVTVISGRALDDVRDLVGVEGLTYAGNHGFEIEGPGVSLRHPGAERFAHALQSAHDGLKSLHIKGAIVEPKGASVSFHYRNVAPRAQAEARRKARVVLRRRRLRVTEGKAVVEGRPPVEWDKGQAALWILTRRHGADWPARVRAVYIGDDTTDEDAFRTLRGIGRSICVAGVPPAGSSADHRLPDPDAVIQFVRWLAAGGFSVRAR